MIDKGIPIPPEYKAPVRGIQASKYAWRHCEEVGDSFVVSEKLSRVEAAMKKFVQRNPKFRFFAKEVKPGEVRVWRVK